MQSVPILRTYIDLAWYQSLSGVDAYHWFVSLGSTVDRQLHNMPACSCFWPCHVWARGAVAEGAVDQSLSSRKAD